jgi:glycosyltransferase involved in cell wall biosynthesis
MKVLMLPPLNQFGKGEGGIRRVIEAYHKHLPEFGIELVGSDSTSYDLTAVHAGAGSGADVAHNHGLYWTADIETLTDYEWQANVAVINGLREAKQITVPSQWVAETIRRDMRIDPHVIGHGVDWDEWQQGANDGSYVLWNKNREVDVCNPEAIIKLAHLFPSQLFLSTFATNSTPNLRVTGQVPFEQMRQMVLSCSVYLSSVKETFGIGVLEAMAAGKPVLGWANGGNLDLVEHGVNGYLAQPDNYEDLANGLDYCLEHRRTLGENGREMARGYTWRKVCEQVARVYELAYNEPPVSVGVVIPVYNKSEVEVIRAIESCLNQSYRPDMIIVVNDGSTDTSGIDAAKAKFSDWPVVFMDQPNQGVAAARNAGIANAKTTFIACLDADDWIDHFFLGECIAALKKDRTIGITYTGLKWHNYETGVSEVSAWPVAYSPGQQFDYENRQNQIPTCAVFRRDAWERVGGYRSRYCPNGAGSEDAAFWSQILSIGYTAKQATSDPLFNYSLGGQVGGDQNYQEIDWLAWLPFSRDKRYPFACSVQPEYYSHPVRQYDEPELSVVIPVGPGHKDDLRTALDSIEAQHFRNWEVIVVFDTGIFDHSELLAAYPYVKWASTGGVGKGPGYARNRGAELAKGNFMLFLDADDFLNPAEPNSLGEMLREYHNTGNGIYSQHIGRAIVSPEYAKFADKEGRLLAFNETLGQAYILNRGVEFDCERACREPGTDPNKIYIWGLISTLIPRQWHFDIGGFDESMPTWEDWDYWLRMAKAGRCFSRIEKPFVVYNYISGERRERGLQIWSEVLQYLRDKHSRIEIMGCGCGNRVRKTASGKEATENMSEDFIEALYVHPNTGRHSVIVAGYNYGRHIGGGNEHFPVRKSDVESNPHLFRPFQQVTAVVPTPETQEMATPAPIAPPEPLPEQTITARGTGGAAVSNDGGMTWVERPSSDNLDLSSLSTFIQTQLRDASLTTKEAIRETGIDGLVLLKGIGPATAKRIMELAE